MSGSIRILIVAPSDRISDSLRVLLRARRNLVIVGQATDSATGLRMIAERPPDLVLLSTGLPEAEVLTMLQELLRNWPLVRCCVLAQNAAQERQACQMGAYAVLQTGFAAEELYQVVEKIHDNRYLQAGKG